MTDQAKAQNSNVQSGSDSIHGVGAARNSLDSRELGQQPAPQPLESNAERLSTDEQPSRQPSEPMVTTTPILPFAFAKRFSIVITGNRTSDNKLEILCAKQPALTTISEVRRLAKEEIAISLVPEAE